MQALELTLEAAVSEAPDTRARLLDLAAAQRSKHTETNKAHTTRCWVPSAGTYCYQTHIAIEDQSWTRLDWLTEVFYSAAKLSSHPWYPQFLGGQAQAVATKCAAGISAHQLTMGRFDVGLPTPRGYRQLVSLASPTDDTRVIVARSVDEGPTLQKDAKLVYTQHPNGEVLHFEDGLLHWHHICCTPGAGVLPGFMDRWLINALRKLGLDQTERKTYHDEAHMMRDWLINDSPELPANAQGD